MLYKHTLLLILFSFSPLVLTENIIVGNFSTNNLSGWEEKEFEGKTTYRLTHFDGRNVLKASSSNAASGLFKKVEIDLNKTPVIHWSWKVKNTLKSLSLIHI